MLSLSFLKLNSPKLHGGKQPCVLLALPPCPELLCCFSLGVSHLGGHSCCLLVVGGQAGMGSTLELIFLATKDGASRGAGPSSDAGGKSQSVVVLGMGQ